MTDWGLAIKIAGGGFGVVFLTLVVLAVVIWVMGLILRRVGTGDNNKT